VPIRIYSSPLCPFCQQAKRFFNEKGLDFEEFNILEDNTAAKRLIEMTGQTGVPVIDIDGKLILGFDRTKIEQALTDLSSL